LDEQFGNTAGNVAGFSLHAGVATKAQSQSDSRGFGTSLFLTLRATCGCPNSFPMDLSILISRPAMNTVVQ
jgi:hypothetical protein